MNNRNCPVCDSNKANVIMRFTPELLAAVNPTYRKKEFENAIKGQKDMLAYSRCRNCGMIYCVNVWNETVLRKVYDDTIDHVMSKDKILYIRKRMSLTRLWLNVLRVLTFTGEKKIENLKVIDYGCGWGDFMDVVQGFGVDVMGYDEDNQKIELPLERKHNVVKNISDLKLFGPVDIFVMNSVLEHLQEVDTTMNLVKKLLKPNGLLVISVMDYRSKFIRGNIKRLNKNMPALTKNLNPVEHVNVYDYKSVISTLKKYHFDFMSTGVVLNLTDFFFLRNSISFINIFNKIEWLSTKIIKGREFGITVFALNQKAGDCAD